MTLPLISCAFKALSYHSFYTRWRSVELGQNTDIGTDGRIAIGRTQFLVKLILKYVMENMHVSDLDRHSSVRPYPRFNPKMWIFFNRVKTRFVRTCKANVINSVFYENNASVVFINYLVILYVKNRECESKQVAKIRTQTNSSARITNEPTHTTANNKSKPLSSFSPNSFAELVVFETHPDSSHF